jgi:hypothetical protein
MTLSYRQKVAVIVGLALMGLSTFVAPYRWVGHWNLAPLVRGGRLSEYVTQGTIYAPLWAAPSRDDVHRATQLGGHDWVADGVVELAVGQLGLWWAGIVVATVAAVLVIGPDSQRTQPPRSETKTAATGRGPHRFR